MNEKPIHDRDSYGDVTGVILAGGKSSRMGRDKAKLTVEGVPLFDRVLDVFRLFFDRILIAGDRPDLERADLPYYPDRYPGSALGGLYTGLYHAETPYIMVAACDMPYPAPVLVRAILELRSDDYDIVMPRTPQGLEPLFAVYGKGCLPFMEAMLERGEYRIYDFYPQVRVRYIDPEEFPEGWQRALLNINTPEEYNRAKEKKP